MKTRKATTKAFPRVHTQRTVYEASCERYARLLREFDTVIVMFSGGKDSTSALHCAMDARESVGGELQVWFFDEEAIPPETIEYVERIRTAYPDGFSWYCVPVKHRNACSRREPYWYPWEPAKRDLWVRDLPENVLLTSPGFQFGMDMEETNDAEIKRIPGRVVQSFGIRAQESLRRQNMVSSKLKDNWIMDHTPKGGVVRAYPIYDWRTEDVWFAPQKFGWDYNQSYNVMDKIGMAPLLQRIGPPFGEEPLRGLHRFKECWPEMWAKMVYRVPGAAAAARYANTDLYGYGSLKPPPGKTWQTWFYDLLGYYPPDVRRMVKKRASEYLGAHQREGLGEIPDEGADPGSGVSWEFLCRVVLLGDFKRRQTTKRLGNRIKAQEQAGLTRDEMRRLRYAKKTAT